MGYCGKCYNVSYHPCSANYSFSGDYSVVSEHFTNSDLPSYTGRFYSPTPQENFARFRYDRVGMDYEGTKDMVEAARGFDVEIPRSIGFDSGASALPSPREIITLPKNEFQEKINDEIRQAQKEIVQREMVMKETQVDELILRRIRKRELVVKDKKPRKIVDQ
jgi:hypothetical protein